MSDSQPHVRQATFEQAESDGRTLEGYAAVFNQRTSIVDHLGTYDEIIAPGAFSHTIRNGRPKLMFDHGQHPMVGSMPLGTIDSLDEDGHGLRVRATLSDNWLIEPIADAVRSGAVDGMSFRFSVPTGKEEWSENQTLRTVREVKLYEFGPVVFPAYEGTSVLVRAAELVGVDLADLAPPPPPPDLEPEYEGLSSGQRAAILRGFVLR